MAEWSDQIERVLARRPRRRIPETSESPPLIRAAVLVPLYSINQQVYVLLTERTEKVDHHKGQISFPGGRRDAADGDELETALREAYEEVGIRRADLKILGALDDMLTTTGFVVTPYVGVMPYPYELNLNEHEVAAALHVPLSVFLDPTHFREELWERNGKMTPIQFYRHQDKVIWGATARILKSFLEITQAGEEPGPLICAPAGFDAAHSAGDLNLPDRPCAPEGPPPAEGFVSTSGRQIHYLEWGRPENPPLALVHGSFQSAHSWEELAKAWQLRYRLLALDQRGHGDSDWAEDYRLEGYVADLEACLEKWRTGPAILLGMSMGGLNALVCAARHPERIAGLVLIDVGPELEEWGLLGIRKFIVSVPDEFASLEEAVEVAGVYNPRRSKENLKQRLSHTLRPQPNGRWVWKHDPRFKTLGGPYSERPLDLWSYWRRVSCPALIVRGEESQVLSRRAAEKMLQLLPGASLAEVPQAGHSVVGDNPAGFLAAVNPFLGRIFPG